MSTISYPDFEKIDLRVGTIIAVHDFPEAHKPAYRLTIDLGSNIGHKHSSAQITQLYTKESLLGRQVLCVCNFQPKQIGSFISEVLTTGCDNHDGMVVLLQPDLSVPNGSRLY